MKDKLNIFIKAICAGVLITIGCIVKLKTENPVAGALLFVLGLYFICHFNLNLFTGKIAYLNKTNWLDLIIIWCGNLFGALITGTGARIAIPSLIPIAQQIIEVKVAAPLYGLAILGIFCGILMFLAVDHYKNKQKSLGIFLGVAGFILAGFEHSIADMGYFVLGYVSGLSLWRVAAVLIVISLSNAFGAIVFYHLTKGKN